MQLNNKLTNEIVKITKIDILQNRISYNILNVDESKVEDRFYNPETNLKTKLDVVTNFKELCLNELKTNVFPDCEIEEDEKNWIHSTREVRLVLKKDTITASLRETNPLKIIIDRLAIENSEAEEKFIFEGAEKVVVYIAEIAQNDQDYVIPYILSGEIINQSK